MNLLTFDYADTCLVSQKDLETLSLYLGVYAQEIKQLLSTRSRYSTDYAALDLPYDQELLVNVEKLVCKVQQLEPKLVIVIGIGGSNLGTAAIFEGVYGKLYNELSQGTKLYCADTLDNNLLQSLLELAERELQKNSTIIVTLVTKSGTTTETLVNGAFFIALLKKYKPANYKEHIVIITDAGSPLYILAQQESYHLLEIPQRVGGRYSVLSAVGLFPLALVGIDIQELMAGARVMLAACLDSALTPNSAFISAALIYDHFRSGKNIHDTFLFSPHLVMLGNWYRQLVGESLGKKHDLRGTVVETGMTPTVSIGTTDLHSVAQLYLGGPRDKFTTFVHVAYEPGDFRVPQSSITCPVPSVGGKTVATIKEAIFKGVQQAYAQEQRPFVTINMPDRTAYSFGQYIMLKMCETIYVGHLLRVNAFDQPAVELYKENTRKILSNSL